MYASIHSTKPERKSCESVGFHVNNKSVGAFATTKLLYSASRLAELMAGRLSGERSVPN